MLFVCIVCVCGLLKFVLCLCLCIVVGFFTARAFLERRYLLFNYVCVTSGMGKFSSFMLPLYFAYDMWLMYLCYPYSSIGSVVCGWWVGSGKLLPVV